ncbi:hypothetical protein QYS48_33215 [Marivirga arenosa]|uniref:Uncharacterized protein n=1 Tax=Marivirga arenosa TaxID=3059076 RepID=A0AA51N6T0_9BACT|nr:hypothetical protein [Marivirga sp. ABR2-2]WMN06655.1 hypothetical protein QYS48_33215 [Marivirga sp. ABR2-2]
MSNTLSIEQSHQRFNELFKELISATSLTKADKAQKLMSQVDLLAADQNGISFLYDNITDLSKAGIFAKSSWEDPSKLVPTLVNGTLKSGHPNSTIEILSELRMLAIAEGKYDHKSVKTDEAENYIQEVFVGNLEFVFKEPKEETRLNMDEVELTKVHELFVFLSSKTNLDSIKEKLTEELTLICEQRPVVTENQRRIIALVKEKIELNPNRKEDQKLLQFQRCIYRPTKNTENKTADEYENSLSEMSNSELYSESQDMSNAMLLYGLVSQYHAVLLLHLINNEHFSIVPVCLGLNPTGEVKWNEYQDFISTLILEIIHRYNAQCIYGLAKMLEKGIFSRQAVRSSIDNMRTIKIHPKVEERILKSTNNPHHDVSARQYLIGALFRILGQPLGVGQGNNPTCQSARGISMWSQHSPAKLINMIQIAATHNDLSFRFEDKEIKASTTAQGLVQKLDHNLDAVSVTIVPMLDRIYNEMMVRASGRGEDPHKWVNPALYGQWIQIGFASAYDYLSNSILDFNGFTKVFYAMCHPEYNGGHKLIYPNPVGIFITSSKGEMLGFHAVSLLRVDEDPEGEMRAYFLNPNNEGRQNWGQNIRPSVYGNGEEHGESSLPIHEFAARTYAFHYNTLEVGAKVGNVPENEVLKVKRLAKESWGKSYTWLETPKQW